MTSWLGTGMSLTFFLQWQYKQFVNTRCIFPDTGCTFRILLACIPAAGHPMHALARMHNALFWISHNIFWIFLPVSQDMSALSQIQLCVSSFTRCSFLIQHLLYNVLTYIYIWISQDTLSLLCFYSMSYVLLRIVLHS